jgi:hypothetical protein
LIATVVGLALLPLSAYVAIAYPSLSPVALMRLAWFVALAVIVLTGLLLLTGRIVGWTIMIVVCLFIA